MNKKVGAIASVLKPVDDTRMYEKMALSLTNTGKFSVNILGFSSNTHSSSADIKFHSILRFKTKKIWRLVANPFVFWKFLIIRPLFIIVCTPELAPSVLLYKLLFPHTKVIYDVQENYVRNLIYHHQQKPFIRKGILRMLNFFEQKLASASWLLIIAEKGYYSEKPWISNFRTLLLENKVLPPTNAVSRTRQSNFKLVYTGTISTIYGIWDALRFVEQLYHALNGNIELTLIGHVTQSETYQKLIKLLSNTPWINANISLQPIPHEKLLSAMLDADFGIVSHKILPSTENCFPTRIWEYMSIELPFFLQNHGPWVKYCAPWHCAIPIDFTKTEWPISKITNMMKDCEFYSNGKPKSIYWEGQKFVSELEEAIAD